MKVKKGQSMVEIAIVLPILLLLLCAIIDFGRILYASMHLNLVTQEAVRMSSLGSSDNEIDNYINTNVDLPDKDTIVVNISPNDLTRNPGDYVTLKITYEVNYITPIISNFIPSPFEVSTQSTMRVE
ncbi:TadE/TadG family type IV pilus assembly protein [Clostridium sp. DL1XJH146]